MSTFRKKIFQKFWKDAFLGYNISYRGSFIFHKAWKTQFYKTPSKTLEHTRHSRSSKYICVRLQKVKWESSLEGYKRSSLLSKRTKPPHIAMLKWPYKHIAWLGISFEQHLKQLTVHLSGEAYRRFGDQDDLLEVVLACELDITRLRHEIYSMTRQLFLDRSFHAESVPKSTYLLQTDSLRLKDYSWSPRSYKLRFYFVEIDTHTVYIDSFDCTT